MSLTVFVMDYMKSYRIILFITLCILSYSSSSCMKTALRLSSYTFSNLAASIFEECDPELAKSSIPANLKMMEGILKNDPNNKVILTTLSLGFCGYGMLYVEADNPERASDLYLRAKDYGMEALGPIGVSLMDFKKKDIDKELANIGEKEFDTLFWTTISWQLWINLNLDNPTAISQLERSESCLERILELDAEYLYGLPYILKGVTLSARPAMMGGDMKQAKQYFEKALELAERNFFPAHYYYARYYSVQMQDQRLFKGLLGEVARGDPKVLSDICLINTMFQIRAAQLAKNIEEYFF
jgi:tetratricopeptide (TPR) repeat protein